MTSLRIGIVDAGIGGLVAAIALHRVCCDVMVFEQAQANVDNFYRRLHEFDLSAT